MTVDYRLIGMRIRDARKENHMTQEDLAEKLDVSVGYVSQVERGATKISLELLGFISAILGKDLSLFVSGTETESPRYMVTELTEKMQKLSDENRRILEATVDAMLKEQNGSK